MSASEEALTGLGTGTYVVDRAPYGTFYVERLTLSRGKRFEADYVTSRGGRTTIGGTYDVFPARPNNPNSPVRSDKPWIALRSDTGPAPSFEIDFLPGGGLKLYHSARYESFTMKNAPGYEPPATTTKTLDCTGPNVNAKLTLDRAQNRRGTLEIRRRAAADDSDPQGGKMNVSIVPDEVSRDWIRFEGTRDDQDFYLGIKKVDFDRATGTAQTNFMWAQYGQQWGLNVTCTFAR